MYTHFYETQSTLSTNSTKLLWNVADVCFEKKYISNSPRSTVPLDSCNFEYISTQAQKEAIHHSIMNWK